MPNTPGKSNASNRRGCESDRIRKSSSSGGGGGGKFLPEKALSFHGRMLPAEMVPESRIRRPKTLPDLFSGKKTLHVGSPATEERCPRLTKLLLNVTVQGSVGAVQVLLSAENTVGDLIVATVKQYKKEGRRQFVDSDPSGFNLHYSQFSLESLDREEKLLELGSRNFFLCPINQSSTSNTSDCDVAATSSSSSNSCSNEVEKPTKNGLQWLRFMDFLK